MSELTEHQIAAIELRKLADIIERVGLNVHCQVQFYAVPGRVIDGMMDLFGGKERFDQQTVGKSQWVEADVVDGVEVVLHRMSCEVAS